MRNFSKRHFSKNVELFGCVLFEKCSEKSRDHTVFLKKIENFQLIQQCKCKRVKICSPLFLVFNYNYFGRLCRPKLFFKSALKLWFLKNPGKRTYLKGKFTEEPFFNFWYVHRFLQEGSKCPKIPFLNILRDICQSKIMWLIVNFKKYCTPLHCRKLFSSSPSCLLHCSYVCASSL